MPQAQKRTFKSKRKLSGVRCTYRAWGDWEVGDWIIGTYKGSKLDQYEKPNWMVEVEDCGGPNVKALKKIVGQTLGLNSSGMLNKAMKNVKEGEVVQVTYNGTAELTKGKFKGKDAHMIEVDLMQAEGEDDETENYEDETDDL